MTRRTLTVLFASLMLSFAGCGDDGDPSKTPNNGVNNGANNGGTNNGGGNNGGTDMGNNGGSNNGANNGGTDMGGNNGETDMGGNNGGTDMGGGECIPNSSFSGQVANQNAVHGGGVPSDTPLTDDASLAAVMAEVPTTEGEDNMLGTVIEVRGATVASTNFGDFGDSNFWVQDKDGAIQVFLTCEGDMCDADPDPANPLIVGQKVDFDVKVVTNFFGIPEITEIENFAVSNTEGGPVYIEDVTDRAITTDDINQIVRVTGTLSNPEACPSDSTTSFCYDLNYGPDTGPQSVEFRVNVGNLSGVTSQDELIGACVTYSGPVGAFDGIPQLRAQNFQWFDLPR